MNRKIIRLEESPKTKRTINGNHKFVKADKWADIKIEDGLVKLEATMSLARHCV